MPSDVLTLGPIVFTDFAIPETFGAGGRQAMKVHKLIGGQRVIDTLGPDDRDLSWAGMFWGPGALYQAQAVDALRAQGQPLPLSWGGGSYVVVIETFNWNVRRLPMCVPYTITCVISSNGAQGNLGGSTQGVDSLVSSDLSDAADTVTSAGG